MRALKALSIVLVVVIALALGYTMGRTQAIHQAELIDAADHEYYIGFGDEIHAYTKEVNPND
jgi:hypothetical protein